MAALPICVCGEKIYPLEQVQFGTTVFHRGCAKCSHCKSTLTISSFASANGKLFCKPHFMQLFSSTGGSYGFADTKTNDAGVAKNVAPVKSTAVDASANKTSSSKLSAFLGRSSTATTASASTSTPPLSSTVAQTPKQEQQQQPQAAPVARSENAPTGMSKLSAFIAATHGAGAGVKSATASSAAPQAKRTSVPEPTPIAAAAPPSAQAQKPSESSSSGLSRLAAFTLATTSSATTTTTSSLSKENAQQNVAASKSVPPPPSSPSKSVSSRAPPPPARTVQFVTTSSNNNTTSDNKAGLHEKSSAGTNVEQLQERNRMLEEEVKVLRARVDLNDSGKEALVQEIIRLMDALEEERRRRVALEQRFKVEENFIQTRRLLEQGKISLKEYEKIIKSIETGKAMLSA